MAATLIFASTLSIFLISRIHQVGDSQFSMLVSQSLLDHGSFKLDAYTITRHEPLWRGYYYSNGPIYQLEIARGHLYYHLPPGSSVLSAPFVAALNLLGVSAAGADRSYDPQGEVKIEAGLAALLMATLAVIFFYTARLLLPTSWSVVLALGGALGTQVYSTASRALWSDTWGILLLGIVIYLLLRSEVEKRSLNPFLLASLLSWMYFVRPTFAVHIFALSIYLIIFHRRLFLWYALTGAVWLAGFVLYSWHNFGQLLPNYYRASRLQFGAFWVAMAGNLVSPARGLLVYVPSLLFVAFLLVRYWRHVTLRRLVWLSLAIMLGHLAAVSSFLHWWGGHSFGPRFTTGLVPWLVLLAILGTKAMLAWREHHGAGKTVAWRAQLGCGVLLLLISAFINTRGATSHATWLWNMRPFELDRHPERLWDWRQPQFMAGILPIPQPSEILPLAPGRIDLTTSEGEKYLWYGWSTADEGERWSDNSSSIIFKLADLRTRTLRLQITPFLVPGKLEEQRVKVALNEQLISTLVLNQPAPEVHSLTLPAELLRERNVLSFEVPNAESPQKLGAGEDARRRGINVQWVELEP
ncbi:MAG TPA: hypothetical protein VJT09_15705 [Pyrinomonadaceae bacterium]|nr:hypothetical protein [Pyrinomonadaceae bacterium]